MGELLGLLLSATGLAREIRVRITWPDRMQPSRPAVIIFNTEYIHWGIWGYDSELTYTNY